MYLIYKMFFKLKNIINLIIALFWLLSFVELKRKTTNKNIPLILGWNEFFNTGNVIHTIAPEDQISKCKHKCFYSENRNDLLNASAIIFHLNSPFNGFPSKRNFNQIYALFNLESPNYLNFNNLFNLNNYFNLTISYLAESKNNLYAPYGGLVKINKKLKTEDNIWTKKEILNIINKKTKLALVLISNCGAISARDEYIEELSKYINITKYGNCYQKLCDKNCYENELTSHFFYLAFENSVCKQYLTEKFWYPFRHLTVPVVLSRAALQGLELPNDAFIGVDDFNNAKELAKYLIKISENKIEYLRFFNWTKFYHRNSDIEPSNRAICKLCELTYLNLPSNSLIIPNISNYLINEGKCIKQFGKLKLIKNETIKNNLNYLIKQRLLIEQNELIYLTFFNIFCLLIQIFCLIYFVKYILKYFYG